MGVQVRMIDYLSYLRSKGNYIVIAIVTHL